MSQWRTWILNEIAVLWKYTSELYIFNFSVIIKILGEVLCCYMQLNQNSIAWSNRIFFYFFLWMWSKFIIIQSTFSKTENNFMQKSSKRSKSVNPVSVFQSPNVRSWAWVVNIGPILTWNLSKAGNFTKNPTNRH